MLFETIERVGEFTLNFVPARQGFHCISLTKVNAPGISQRGAGVQMTGAFFWSFSVLLLGKLLQYCYESLTLLLLLFHCLILGWKGLGTSLQIMELAAIDPHSHKVHTKLYKIPKFGANRPNSKQDITIWKCQNLQTNVWPSGRCVRMTKYFCVILSFLNGCNSVNTSLINTKLKDFGNIGVLCLTMWINSC